MPETRPFGMIVIAVETHTAENRLRESRREIHWNEIKEHAENSRKIGSTRKSPKPDQVTAVLVITVMRIQ